MSDGETYDDAIVSVFAPGRSVAEPPDDRVVMTDSASVAAEAEAIVAVGGGALAALAVAGVSTPVFPIRDADPLAAIPEALDRLSDGTDGVRQRPVVGVETPDESTGSLRDVSLTAAEPGTISAFTVERDDDAGGSVETNEDRVARFRADGVVVATPTGSDGYAHAAGGPVVGAGSDVLAVVPVAPFATDPDHWVLPLSSLSMTVERDVDVSVTVDGRPFSTLSPNTTVRFGRAGTLPILPAPERG